MYKDYHKARYTIQLKSNHQYVWDVKKDEVKSCSNEIKLTAEKYYSLIKKLNWLKISYESNICELDNDEEKFNEDYLWRD